MDQEFFSHLSYREEADDFVADALLASTLARVEQPWPSHRPEATLKQGRQFDSAYVDALQPGTDGIELTDYDLIGSRKSHTGLFALEQVEDLDLLYLPPPGRGMDVGPAAVLVAEQFSRERCSMLLIDPCAQWQDAIQAVHGVRELGYASPNMIGYFPRVTVREDGDEQIRPAGSAIAGLLCISRRNCSGSMPAS